ncbi:IQ motif and ankyrin repeat domain-containing protein 1-like isoform X2 [Oscarella lobularis]|uniref:IQ motif and ankyrin repeat domain-containing protein 1-like isoform X2 n=1 Tax=Oscarella lobularis TaxID=121494 RepID=UPI00331444B0
MPPKRIAAKAATKTNRTSTGSAATATARKPVVAAAAARGNVGAVRGRGIANVASRGRGRGGRGVSSSPAKVAGDAKQKSKSAAKKWTKVEEAAARKIQTKYRQYRAKKELAKKRKEKKEYDELMDKIQRDAWVQLIKMERDEEEKQKRKYEEERRRKREEERRKKRLLEAAFDGDNDEIIAVLREARQVALEKCEEQGFPTGMIEATIRRRLERFIDSTDANGNTPLSESANGGNPETVRLLIDKGADVNTKGQYGRTPLYRAAFAGHTNAVEVLLEFGADPRIYADDGATPVQIASVSAVVSRLEEWTIEKTDSILAKMAEEKENKAKEERKRNEEQTGRLQNKLKEAEKEYETAQKQLAKAYEELNKRIYEHDKSAAIGAVKPEVTLQIIHDSEAILDEAKARAEKTQKIVDEVNTRLKLLILDSSVFFQRRLALREQQNPDENEKNRESEIGIKVSIRELDDVLLRDVGNRIASDGRWPLLIDTSKQASTFLRYRDTNYLDALHPRDMDPETIRMNVLGAIRYGKFVVLDLRDVDIWHVVTQKFDVVQKDLLKSIMTKEIMKEDKYLGLVRKTDGEQYGKNNFNRVENFKFVVVTRMRRPPDELVRQTYPIRIFVPEPRNV